MDGIPVLGVAPEDPGRSAPIALWLPQLGATKEDCRDALGRLAGAGFLSLSLDPWQHGERGLPDDGRSPAPRVFGNFRRHMWPILGQTTLDALRVVDWAVEQFGATPSVVAGGVSMGGDIAVALAGIDARVTRVAAVVATPDWTRPGMRDVTDPTRILPQGAADHYAQWFYDHLNPLTHLDRYARGPAIRFECAADDTHVPPDGAQRFRVALAEAHPDAAARVHVERHPGFGHIDGAASDALNTAALGWLTAEGPTSQER